MKQFISTIKKRKVYFGILFVAFIVVHICNYIDKNNCTKNILNSYQFKNIHVLNVEQKVHREFYGGNKGTQPKAVDSEYILVTSDSVDEFRIDESSVGYSLFKKILKPNTKKMIKFIRNEHGQISLCDIQEDNGNFYFENSIEGDMCINDAIKEYRFRERITNVAATIILIIVLVY